MRIQPGLVRVAIAIVAAATACGGYDSPSQPNTPTGADSTQDSTPPPPSPYLYR
jgi:hypothetical protein